MIIRYDSTAKLRQSYIDLGCKKTKSMSYGVSDSWFNNESEEDTLRKLELGDTSLVPDAELLLSQLEDHIETPRRQWERNVAGAFPCVPDVIAGLPTPMRRMVIVPDDRAPITIFVDTGSSAAVSSEILKKRGIVILALVIALTRVRPTILYQLDVGSGIKDGESILVTEINTTPLDLATACYVLTSAGFARRIVYEVENKLNGNSGNWPQGYNFTNPEAYYAKLKPKLVTDPSRCLIIPAARSIDELLSQPLVWINKQINRFTNVNEEGEA